MASYKNLSLANLRLLAANLGSTLAGKKALIGLVGPLGAGKTTFVKSLAQQFGVRKISSPTFVITHEYKIKQGRLFHLDFYRLTKPQQLISLGIPEMLTGKNIILIEWVEKFPKIAAQCDLIIKLIPKSEHKRDVYITTH